MTDDKDDATIRSWPPMTEADDRPKWLRDDHTGYVRMPPIDAGTLFDAALHVAATTTAHIHLWVDLCRAECSCKLPVALQQCEDCGRLRVLAGTEILMAGGG